MKVKTRWGWNEADGVWFFFEMNREPQSFCPLTPPKDTLFCPHRTPKGVPVLKHLEPSIYWTTDSIKFDKRYEVRHSRIKYYGVGTLKEMFEMSRETNYIPIIIGSVRITEDWYKFVMRLEQFVENEQRSVVLELVDEFVPVLPNWKKLTDLKSMGLKRS